jgi:hypothetical protein
MEEGSMPSREPQRQVYRAEALAWLAEHPADANAAIVTSLPDFSELRELEFEAWRTWFVLAATSALAWVKANGFAIFFQTDVRRRGTWIDKSFLLLCAAESAGARLLWHKVICRTPPDTLAHGRAGYSHLLCFTRSAEFASSSQSPDVIADAGFKPAENGMGVAACSLACRFLLEETGARSVVDPFCGRGTVLAVANGLGLDAIGVDRSARRCSEARKLDLARLG